MEEYLKNVGNLITTAMGVMPHTDVERALEFSLSMDVPFWPQLPLYSYREDMYVQAAEHFPGIVIDEKSRTIRFNTEKFYKELEDVLINFENLDFFDVSDEFSVVYRKFLELPLDRYVSIRGQLEGPISLGFYVKDENDKPIIFNDEVREFMIEFMARRMNAQLSRLKKKHPNAFIFIDEPGLQFVFSAMSGYNDVSARKDMERFLSAVERPRGIHLCGNPDWDFLFSFDMEIVSIDLYTNRDIIPLHARSIKDFVERGGRVVWGIVPTNYEPFIKETKDSLKSLLKSTWREIVRQGLDFDLLLSRSLLSPATCCLVNKDREKTVEKAFLMLKEISGELREEFKLS